MPKELPRIYHSISALFSFAFIKEKYCITLLFSKEHNDYLRMKKILIWTLILLLNACQKSVENNNCFFLSSKEAKVSDIVKNYILIALETTEDNLILDPTVVKISQDKIFVLDRFSPSKSLYVFLKSGKYIGKIGNKGEGPGEYVMPHSFVINERDNRLFLRDMATNKILVYDLSTFQFVEDYTLPFYATCFEMLGDDYFIWYVNAGLQNEGNFRKHIQITDTKCKPISSFIETMLFPERGLFNVQSYFSMSETETYFHHPYYGRLLPLFFARLFSSTDFYSLFRRFKFSIQRLCN